jgi:type I restriction enzyme, S subunit
MMEGWKHIEINKIVLKTRLKDPTKEPEKQFYYIDVSSVSNILFKIAEPNYMTGKEAPSRARKLIQTEDVIFATVRPTLKRIAFIPKEFDGQICSTGYCVLKADKNQVDPLFLYFSLLPDFFMEKIEKLQRGASYPAIRDYDLKSQKIFLPSLPEQHKIAYILNTVQKAIEQQDKLIRQTTELKKALMQKLFTEGTKGEKQKQTEIGLAPESWDVVELSEVCEKPQYGFTDSASATGNAKFLRITDITEFGVNWKDVPFCNCPDFSKYELKDGDIVFARIGATTGKSYLINNPPKSVYASYLIRVRCKEEILPEFLIYYFASEHYWKQIDATKGNNLKGGVNGSILSKLLIPKPSITEQMQIANSLKALDSKLAFSLKKKQTLSDLFKTLLHELMTGQRRVHEIEFEALTKAYKIEEQPLRMVAEK